MKEEITSEVKNVLVESQRELLKLLKPKIRDKISEGNEKLPENESRIFYTPTKSVRIGNCQNNDPNRSRNTKGPPLDFRRSITFFISEKGF